MRRYLFEISFNGAEYHGWQIQDNAITVQQVIQESISTLVDDLVNIVGCGRTDTGVHAKQFFFHVDLPEIKDIIKFVYHLNQILPQDISVLNCKSVNSDFHARFSAVSRTYKYYVIQHKDPFFQSTSKYVSNDLDVEIMNICCQKLLKYKDFTSFSKVHTDVNNFNCDILSASWNKENNHLIFTIKANRFLRNMVRAVVGTMLLAGKNKIDVNRFCEIIEEKNRSSAGSSVLAKGLFLTNVEYPDYE